MEQSASLTGGIAGVSFLPLPALVAAVALCIHFEFGIIILACQDRTMEW